jgi:hypothetical protein
MGWRPPPSRAPRSVLRETLGAQRDRLVQADALADHGRLADHDAGAVVDEEAAPICAPG